MKKNFKIKTLIACVAILIASLFLSVSFYSTPASAAGTVFEMEYGASVKLSTNGLRFTAKMDKEYRDYIVDNAHIELWGYIAPTEEFDKVTDYNFAVKVGGKLDESKIYLGEDGYYRTNIVITELDEYTSGGKYLYGKSFSAIVFIKDTSTNSYIYADLAKGDNGVSDIALQNRTQYDVINSAMLDASESYENAIMSAYGSWYGASDEYPIMLDSEEDIDAFASKLNDATFKNAVSGKKVFVSYALASVANATIPQDASVTVSAGHKVNFWDGNKLIKILFVANGENAQNFTPTRVGYNFVEWTGGSLSDVTEDRNLYAKWKATKGAKTDIGNMTVYGVTRADGADITEDADVIGEKVTLASGYLGDGAFYPGETNSTPDPTDENDTADQAFLAFDGNYGFGDYFVAEFTGKNMPTLAFLANNYDNSIFYGDGTKNGVVVSTGITWPDGRLFTEGTAYCTSVFNGEGLCMWGPHMIYSTAKNNNPSGVLLHSNEANVALGRANLVAGKQYRIIMGMEPGDDASNKAIKLVYVLYDMDNDCVVESRSINTYNFFADGWANAGQTRDQYCQGSIVAYGYFGTPTVLDKVYNIYEDTNIDEISKEFGMATANNATVNGDEVTLVAGSIGAGANYTIGQNAGGSITQSYFALNGNYGFDDYIALDFTGKNMPEVMFFAENYDTSMYYSAGKQGVVVASGITLWDGSIGSAQANNTKVGVSGPFGAYFEGAAAPRGGNMLSDFTANLARANLVDGKQYRVIMGFTKASSTTFSLKYLLYNLTDGVVVEEVTQTSWAFFTGSNSAVNNMTLDGWSGAIVLYGKFSTTCVIDKIHGVFENTTIDAIKGQLEIDQKTITFKNWNGEDLQVLQVSSGIVPEYTGATPTRDGDAINSSYVFAGWDKDVVAVTGDTVYTAKFTGTKRDSISLSTSRGVTIDGTNVTLLKGST